MSERDGDPEAPDHPAHLEQSGAQSAERSRRTADRDAIPVPVRRETTNPGAAPAPTAIRADTRAPTIPQAAQPERRRRRRETLPGVEPARRGFRQRVQHFVDRAQRMESARRRLAVPVYMLRIAIQVVRKWARDRCPQQAASLAFQTVLSMVPLLAVALAVLRATGSIHEQSALVDFISRTYIPVNRETIADTLLSWSDNVSFKSLGVFGLITTLVLAFVMFNTLERVMNDIWRAERRRPLAQKFVVFYALVTLVPFGLGVSLYQMSRIGLGNPVWTLLLSLSATFGVTLFCNFVLPKATVQLKAATIGALFSAVLFELAKYAFNTYASSVAFDKYTGIYGAVAIAPLFLIWVYWSWLVLLLGTEVAYAAQHLDLLERSERRGKMSLENELVRRVNGVVAARVMAAIAETYLAGGKVCTRRSLTDRFDMSDEVLDRLAHRLEDADLIIAVEGERTGFVPARPPHEISLGSILSVFRGDDVAERQAHAETELDRVLREIEQDTRDRTRGLYLDQLVDLQVPRERRRGSGDDR